MPITFRRGKIKTGVPQAIPSLGEFLELRGKQESPLVVYFDKRQWANLTWGLKPTDKKPPRKRA